MTILRTHLLSLLSLSFLPMASLPALASPCNGMHISISNQTGGTLTVSQIEIQMGTISNLSVGQVLAAGSVTSNIQASSSNNTKGNAVGTLHLTSQQGANITFVYGGFELSSHECVTTGSFDVFGPQIAATNLEARGSDRGGPSVAVVFTATSSGGSNTP